MRLKYYSGIFILILFVLAGCTARETTKEKEVKKVLSFSETLYKYFVATYEYAKGISGTHLAASLSAVVSTYGLYKNGSNHYGYVCSGTNHIEAMIFQLGFLVFLAFYIYAWLATIAAAYHQETRKKIKAE